MKVRMVVEMSGTRNGEPWPARGEILDTTESEALDLVHAGIATRVQDAPKVTPADAGVETATAPQAEERVDPLTTRSGRGTTRG